MNKFVEQGLLDGERHIHTFSVAYPEVRQSAYLREEALKHFHYIFPTLENTIRDIWQDEENVLIKVYDERMVKRTRINSKGIEEVVEEPRGEVSYSLYSFAYIEAGIQQFQLMNLEAKLEIHKLYEKEEGLAQTITTPVAKLTLLRPKGEGNKMSMDMAKIDDYNKHFDQIFSIVQKLYSGKLSKKDVEDKNASLLSRYIMYNYPKMLFIADYYDVLNKERIALKQRTEKFKSYCYTFITNFENDCDKVASAFETNYQKTEKAIDRITKKLHIAIDYVSSCKKQEREEKGRKLRKIILKLRSLEN